MVNLETQPCSTLGFNYFLLLGLDYQVLLYSQSELKMKPKIKSISTSKLVIDRVILFPSRRLLSSKLKRFCFNILNQAIMVKSRILYSKHLHEYCFLLQTSYNFSKKTIIISTWWKSGWQDQSTWWWAIIQQENILCHNFYSNQYM